MRRWLVVVAGIVLVAALALAIMPVLARSGGPRTVEEQAEWIGETWAAWLWDDCGETLAPETIAGPREELVEGLKARLEAPLNSEQYAMVQSCMMGGVDGYAPTRPPLELELRQSVRQNLYKVDWYLAHPEPDTELWTEVGGQVSEVFYVAQEALLAELMPLAPDPDTGRRAVLSGVLLGGVQHVLPLIGSVTIPMFKRPYTPEEMADLRAVAKRAAQWARADLEGDLVELGQSRPYVVSPGALESAASRGAQETANALRQVFWDEWPPFLSVQEQRQLEEARVARSSQRGPTGYTPPQVEVDPETGRLVSPAGVAEAGAQ